MTTYRNLTHTNGQAESEQSQTAFQCALAQQLLQQRLFAMTE